jgi:non-specific serine/threonine protein kinase/serine/threonine-protein kinase
MTPDQWQQVKALWQAALERAPHQRAAFLAEACAGDGALQREVASLLASYEQAGSFIEAPAVAGAAPWLADEQDPAVVGQLIGSYKVIRALGHGGMGTVYLAVRADDHYRKRVAIKLVTPGMGTGSLRRRFRTERQILASLDHPNIAKLLDGGTTADGRPYLVMDYVEGLPIDAYCDRHTLSINERLQLFCAVCAAVHHAHQNLVVHRDLKPSNILVTADGVPKLLDFGIAKLLNPELAAPTLALTTLGLQLMTPEYASPEQVRGEPLTTASDIYALGVLLYELLTGHRPYRLTSRLPHDVVRAICEEDPQKPSTAIGRSAEVPGVGGTRRITPETVSQTRGDAPDKLRRRLAGDLDTIVLMALRKEPQRRYGSAAQLAEDLRRHLEGLPVVARKHTLGYRSAKFLRRHVLGSLVGSLWQARVAQVERVRADRRFNDVRQLTNMFLFEFHDAIKDLVGSTPARELLVTRALEYLDSLAHEASEDPSLQLELAVAYQKVGDVQGHPTAANLGDSAGALESYRQALTLAGRVVTAHPTQAQARQSLAVIYQKLSDMQAWTGDVARAVETSQKSLALFAALAEADPTHVLARQALALSHIKMGDVLGNPLFPNAGDLAGALQQYRQALELYQALAAVDATDRTTRRYLGLTYERLGTILKAQGELIAALDTYRTSLALRDAFAADYPAHTDGRRDLGIGYEKIGDVLLLTGDLPGALAHYQQSLPIFDALAAADPHNAQARHSLAISYEKLVEVRTRTGDTPGALALALQSLALREALATADPLNVRFRTALAQTLHRVAALSAQTGRLDDARHYTGRLIALQQGVVEQASATAAEVHAYARTLLTCVPADLQKPATALRYARQAVAMTHGQEATLLSTLALAYHRTGEQTRAIAMVEQARALGPGDAAQRQELEVQLAQCTAALQQAPER